jgi:predicted KAP-like P-loop ATPase
MNIQESLEKEEFLTEKLISGIEKFKEYPKFVQDQLLFLNSQMVIDFVVELLKVIGPEYMEEILSEFCKHCHKYVGDGLCCI